MLTRLRRLRCHLPGRNRDERGATAIITAFMCIVLFGIAALSVDLGNAFARRTDTQTQADYGALAAARLQTETAKSGMTISSAMVDAVRDAFNNNQPQDDSGTCWTTKTCVVSGQLTDNNLLNGEIRYCGAGGPSCGTGYAATVKGLQVFAPRNRIDYGFANIFGVGNGNVSADALVNVFTAGKRVMPMYAVTGCDYGLQTLADPANGHTTPAVPTIAYDTDTNTTDLTPLSQELRDSTNAVVASLEFDSTGNTVSFEAKKWVNATKIGFFRSDSALPADVKEVTTFWLSTDATKTNLAPFTENNARTVKLNIPDAVADVETVWWIRVFNATTGKWSPKSTALGVRVGEAVLECDAGSSAGNFGTLKFPRTLSPSDWIPANIALGLEPPLTAEVHEYAVANLATAGQCTDGLNGAIVSVSTLRPGTNCVDTDTGLSANFATQGLVQGGSWGTGMLRTQNTRTGCAPNGGNDNRDVTFSGTTYSINNDVLTCYFTNGTTSIADIAKASYSGGVVLDPAILKSPRFFYVPVLNIQPSGGGSNTYSIVDFRAAFLTDETATTTAIKGSKTGTNNNGVITQGQDIKQLKVVFFNDDALPIDGDIPIIDYLGSGKRVIRLLD